MRALLIAIPGGIAFTAAAYYIAERLSSDAMAMALGLLLGVLAGLPAAALVLAAWRSAPAPDYDWIDGEATAYADEVTPYTHTFRRVAGLPALPSRQAEIDQLRAALDYIEAQDVQP